MRGEFFLVLGCSSTLNKVIERQAVLLSPQSACPVFPETIAYLHSGGHGFSKNTPRLVGASWKRADIRELKLRVLRAITAPKRSDDADKLSPKLQSPFNNRIVDELA